MVVGLEVTGSVAGVDQDGICYNMVENKLNYLVLLNKLILKVPATSHS